MCIETDYQCFVQFVQGSKLTGIAAYKQYRLHQWELNCFLWIELVHYHTSIISFIFFQSDFLHFFQKSFSVLIISISCTLTCNNIYGIFTSCIQFDLYYKYWCLLGTLFLVIFVNFFKNSYADSVTRGTQRVLGYPSFYLSIYSSFHPSCQSARLEIYNFLISWTWI